VKQIFRWRHWKKVNGQSDGRPLNHCNVGNLDAAMQNVRAATEASALGVRSLRMLLSLISGGGGKNSFFHAVSGRNHLAGAGSAIQLFAANFRERQIS
jgi:hypothetical protein